MIRYFIILLIISTVCLAQEQPIQVDFNSPVWKTMGNAEVTEFDGKTVTRVLDGTALAYLDGLDFSNGTIECDMYSPSDRAFIGLAFRIQNFINFEWIYFSPHNSNSWDAVQYDPIFNQSATWQMYHGEGFQAKARVPVREWFHVRVEVMNDSAHVYLDNGPDAVLSVPLRHDLHSGLLGVCSYHPAIFANLVITRKDSVVENVSPGLAPYNYINSWKISEPFQGPVTNVKAAMDTLCKISGSMQMYVSDSRGIINLNSFFLKTADKNTVFACVNINSDSVQTKTLHFGFSDKAWIYLNGKEIYSGDNSYIESDRWQDRGYVYDEYASVELSLVKGTNKLILQLYEDKFGWGYTMRLDNYFGVSIEPARIMHWD